MKDFWALLMYMIQNILKNMWSNQPMPPMPEEPVIDPPIGEPPVKDPPIEEPPTVGVWATLQPGQKIEIPYKPRVEFWVKGIDSRVTKEWHLFNYAHGRATRSEKEYMNAHFMIYGGDNRIIQQDYSVTPPDEQHITDDLFFEPKKAYKFIVDVNRKGFRVQIFENGTIPKVDMFQERHGKRGFILWKNPFMQINSLIELGAGTFPGYDAPNAIQVK